MNHITFVKIFISTLRSLHAHLSNTCHSIKPRASLPRTIRIIISWQTIFGCVQSIEVRRVPQQSYCKLLWKSPQKKPVFTEAAPLHPKCPKTLSFHAYRSETQSLRGLCLDIDLWAYSRLRKNDALAESTSKARVANEDTLRPLASRFSTFF